MANGNPIWPGSRKEREYADVLAFLRDMLAVEGWHPQVHDWFQKTLDEILRLRELIGTKVGGETPGDCLIRLSKTIRGFKRTDHVSGRDWREWISDFGKQLNAAAEGGKRDGKT